jgi:hypothetical protein
VGNCVGTLPLRCALLKAAKLYASKSGARYFIRVCLGKPVSGVTVRLFDVEESFPI